MFAAGLQPEKIPGRCNGVVPAKPIRGRNAIRSIDQWSRMACSQSAAGRNPDKAGGFARRLPTAYGRDAAQWCGDTDCGADMVGPFGAASALATHLDPRSVSSRSVGCAAGRADPVGERRMPVRRAGRVGWCTGDRNRGGSSRVFLSRHGSGDNSAEGSARRSASPGFIRLLVTVRCASTAGASQANATKLRGLAPGSGSGGRKCLCHRGQRVALARAAGCAW